MDFNWHINMLKSIENIIFVELSTNWLPFAQHITNILAPPLRELWRTDIMCVISSVVLGRWLMRVAMCCKALPIIHQVCRIGNVKLSRILQLTHICALYIQCIKFKISTTKLSNNLVSHLIQPTIFNYE